MTTAVRQLAIDIHNALQPNVSLAALEERVWMLKTRNIPDGRVRRIIEEEFAGDTTTEPTIVVERLPPHLDRTDWR